MGREFYKSFEPISVWMERPICFDPRGQEHFPIDQNQWPRHGLYEVKQKHRKLPPSPLTTIYETPEKKIAVEPLKVPSAPKKPRKQKIPDMSISQSKKPRSRIDLPPPRQRTSMDWMMYLENDFEDKS